MRKALVIFVVFLSMLWTTGAFAELKEGLWEITTQVQMEGIPDSIPPSTIRQCVTKDDPVPKNEEKGYDCKTIDQKANGNKVSYTVECKLKEGVIRTSGTATYTDKSMSGEATTTLKMGGEPPIQMESTVKGKYVGACPNK